MKKNLFFIVVLFTFNGFSQLNLDSVGHVNYQVLHGTNLNDIWGYTDEMDNEYALVGTEDGVGIVDISIPSAPNEVFWSPGVNSTWRDLKTFGDYAYITNEFGGGLQIIDMSPLPSSAALTTTNYTGPIGQEWTSAHNLYIDENGYCYIFGANRGNKGVIILDLFTDPMNPTEVGVFDNWYVHDGYVANDTMYLGHILDGFLSIVDVVDKANPIVLGTQFTPSTFTHNVWASANGQYAFTTDEVSGGYLGAYDISNPANIFEVDRIQSSPDVGIIIPHNTHVKGNHIITSYYTDGVVIHDVTYPYNMIEVGNYDTHPDQSSNFDGCWGVYPFFASEIILATDRSEGLFILAPNYTQGCYLEGLVTDASTTSPITDVEISFAQNTILENSNSTGFYATGVANSGNFDVTYSKVSYFPQTVNLDLVNGVIVNQDIQLTPIPAFPFDVTVLDIVTGNPILDVVIRLEAILITAEGLTNGFGVENFNLFYEENYKITIGKWGYVTYCDELFIDASTGSLTVMLKEGIYDDFSFDFGWLAVGTATTGAWERALPLASSVGSAPGNDENADCGGYAYVTENSENVVPDSGDIDNGSADLISPVMDLTGYNDPSVIYSRWFYNNFGPFTPDDTLRISVSNGTASVEIDKIGRDPSTFFQWVEKRIRLEDYITVTSTMQFFFRTGDFDPIINITEAGLDKFMIVNIEELNIEELEAVFIVYPNPTNSFINVKGLKNDADYSLIDIKGKPVQEGIISFANPSIDIRNLNNGFYFMQLNGEVYKVNKGN